MTETTSANGDLTSPRLGDQNHPLVSVVIPAYNCAAYLRRAIDSVLTQSYQAIECIVVDDGSTDQTSQVAAHYGDRIIFLSQPNRGASAARNTGIARATGEFIAFLDADDYWHPTKLEKQINACRDNPDIVLISTGLATHDADPATRSLQDQLATAPYSSSAVEVHRSIVPLLRDPYLGTPSVLVRTDRAREVGGFDTRLSIGEDLDFYFRICSRRPYARLAQPLTTIHQRPGTLTHTQPGYRTTLDLLDRLEQDDPDIATTYAQELQERRLAVYENWIRKCIASGRGTTARMLIRESRDHGTAYFQAALFAKSLFAPLLALLRGAHRPGLLGSRETNTRK